MKRTAIVTNYTGYNFKAMIGVLTGCAQGSREAGHTKTFPLVRIRGGVRTCPVVLTGNRVTYVYQQSKKRFFFKYLYTHFTFDS